MTDKSPCLRHRLVRACAAACYAVALSSAATAGPIPCAKAQTPEQRAAVAAAEAWHAARWQHTSGRWMAAYELKPAPALPLGMGSFKGAAAFVDTVAPAVNQVIRGVVSVAALTCTTYELSTDHTIVVRFSGRSLSFNENAGGWSRPLPAAVLHVLEINSANGPAAVPVPSTRTALPPDAQLSLPAPADVAQTSAPRRRP